MPGPEAISTRSRVAASSTTDAPAPSAPPPPSASDVRDAATAQVFESRRPAAARPSAEQRAVGLVAREFLRTDVASASVSLAMRDPAARTALARMSPEQLERALVAAGVDASDASMLRGRVGDAIGERIQTEMRRHMGAAIDREQASVRDMRAAVADAAPDSPVGRIIAQAAQRHGTSFEVQRDQLLEHYDARLEQLEGYETYVEAGQHWEVGDLPELSRSAAARLGFDADAPMVRAALERRSSDTSVESIAGRAQMGGEILHGLLEIYHAVHELSSAGVAGEGVAAAAGAAVGVAGVGAGFAIHKWTEHRHEQFLADMNAMTR
ncbi:MAG: hypothetical protein H6721_29050 [Sandaracinus sp.]|nr:hypothetical protein [Sandaracinus sp.]